MRLGASTAPTTSALPEAAQDSHNCVLQLQHGAHWGDVTLVGWRCERGLGISTPFCYVL
jgi:hypothetical protein